MTSKEKELTSVINTQMDHLEAIVSELEEFSVLLVSYLELLNHQDVGPIALKFFDNWITKKTSDSIAIKAILQTLTPFIYHVGIAGVLLETAINSYFFNCKFFFTFIIDLYFLLSILNSLFSLLFIFLYLNYFFI